MKAFRYLILTLALLLPAIFSSPAPGAEYAGSFFTWTGPETVTSTIYVSAAGQVTNVGLFIRNAQTQLGFDNNAMLLTSPIGTTIYLFDLSAYKITGTSLYLTRFIDTAPVIITEGVPPYAGSFRPGESFSNFNGEWMTGTWTLAVYNHRPGTANTGAVTDWSLFINQSTPVPTPSPLVPTPSPVPVVYREFSGDWFSWTGASTTLSYISIGNQGIITDVNVNMNAHCTASLDPLGMYLRSPGGKNVGLFNKHDLEETTLYLTTFDDAADQSIKNGLAPYIGLYRPVESLALFNSETVTGNWTLVAYNEDAGNNGTVTDWSLIIGIRDFVPSPTPTPIMTPTPSPPPTMTPPPTPKPTVSPYAHCPIYQGTPFMIDSPGVETRSITLTSTHRVAKVMVNVENFFVGGNNDLDNIGIYLISPREKVVALFEKHQLSEHALSGTWFDDSSTTNIVDGVGPYVGHFHPSGNLSDLCGEPIAGNWKLLVFNDYSYIGGEAYLNEWAIEICEAAPTRTPPPVTPTPTITPVSQCWDYAGGGVSWTGVTAASSGIYVGHSGGVTNVEVRLSAECSDSLADIGIYLVNPAGTDIALFQVGDLADHIMYQTYFDDDTVNRIRDGIAPYLGIYHPVEELAGLNNSASAGIWNLLVYNNSPTNSGNVSDWELHLCIEGAAPTSTMTPTPPPTPHGPTTPTPIEVCPVSFGDAFTAPGQEVTWKPIVVDGSGLVKKITVKIDRFDITEEGDLDSVGMWLVSPDETVVELFPKHQLSEHSLSATWFDDSATREITEGLGPYIGRWRPTGRLSDFYGQAIKGIWKLVVFNDFVCVQIPGNPPCEDWSRMEENWQLVICPQLTRTPTPTPTATIPTPTLTPYGHKTPIPTPPTPTPPLPVCTDYNGEFFTLSDVGTEIGEISISEQGAVSKVTVEITARCSDDLDNVGIYLRSPHLTDVPLFEKHQLSEHALYKTIFDDDAQLLINAAGNLSPYLGSYRPADFANRPLSMFEKESIHGTWSLVVYNDLASNVVEIQEWILTICKVPTPTPTPRDTPTPAPTALSTPIPILESGDYDDDGTSDIGVFRPSQGLWSVRGVGTSFFGKAGDLPASGDYDGDGTTDIAIFRSSNGLWAVSAVTRVYFGKSGDITIPGDYNGDGVADIGVFRKSSGLWAVKGVTRRYFGTSTDYPVPADYDGDGAADPAVFRSSSGLWAVRGVTRVYFGTAGDLPLVRDFYGDGTSEIGIFRASSGLWAIRGLTRFYFGTIGDYPLSANFRGDGTDYPGIFRASSGLWALRGITRVYYGGTGDIPIVR